LFGKALRNSQLIDGMYPVESLGNQARLVGLQRTDEMPVKPQRPQLVDLGKALLNIAFAKSALAGGCQLTYGSGRPVFAHGEQANIGGVTAVLPRGAGDSRENGLQLGSKCGHNRALRRFQEYSTAPCPVARGPNRMDITELLAFSVKNKASDLHLSAGLPPIIRVNGDVRRINLPAMEHKDVHAMVYDIMSDSQRKQYEDTRECDFSFEIPNLARFRVNAFVQNRGAGAVFRTIPSKVLTLEDLNCPRIFKDISDYPRGIVLVTGPTGSGKSTTLAAMINHVNENAYSHILTVEDPIEFVHQPKKCLINQREIGPHTLSFQNALRSALREDPDVILVGEMRDLETIRLALTGAETGHLVFATLHTSSAAKTIDRIVDVFPAAEKEMVRSMLSESLRAVISQTLLKTKDGQGRVAAYEILIGTPAIRNLIRENKVAQMYSSLQTGQQFGMQTLDQCLLELVKRNIVSAPEARAKAANKDAFAGV
jgi:twitching motility protein PilT